MDTQKMRAAIIGIKAYIPPYILTNDELSNMVDTTDEWIMTHMPARSSAGRGLRI